MERERLGTTGIGHGIAIPHARLPEIDHLVGLFARLDHPVDFELLDDLPSDLIFLLLAPDLSRCGQSEGARPDLARAARPDAQAALAAGERSRRGLSDADAEAGVPCRLMPPGRAGRGRALGRDCRRSSPRAALAACQLRRDQPDRRRPGRPLGQRQIRPRPASDRCRRTAGRRRPARGRARRRRAVRAAAATLAGLLEVRGFGIVRLPYGALCRLGLIVDLDPRARPERLPEPESRQFLGLALPCLRLDPQTPSAGAKVRLALAAERFA